MQRLTEIQVQSEQSSERLGHDDDRVAKVREIDHEQRQGSQGGKQELVSPAQVQHVVSESQEDHAADGQKSPDQLHKLRGGMSTAETASQGLKPKVERSDGRPTHLVVREALTLVPHKAAEERHWDEAEEDDEEDRPTDHTLGLRAANESTQDQGEGGSKEHRLTALWGGGGGLTFPFWWFYSDPSRTAWRR